MTVFPGRPVLCESDMFRKLHSIPAVNLENERGVLFYSTNRPSCITGGFTLVELLIVVAIIAILAAIAIPNFLDAQIRAKVSRTRSDLRTVALALESYATEHTKYPPMLGPNDGTGQAENQWNAYGSVRLNSWRGVPQNITTPIAYLSSVIPDPFKSKAVATQTDDNATPDVGKPFANGNPFDASFVYHYVRQFVEHDQAGGFMNADTSVFGQWRLYSFGPDQKFSAIYTLDLSPYGIYDPTNGSVSDGEIVRTQVEPEGRRYR
jgi:prepilin-type N-terminal cleavage/methylation domain-containing protein